MSPSSLPSFFKFKAQPLKEFRKNFHSTTISSSEIVVSDDSCYGLKNILPVFNCTLFVERALIRGRRLIEGGVYLIFLDFRRAFIGGRR